VKRIALFCSAFLCAAFAGLSLWLMEKEFTPFLNDDVITARQSSSFDVNRDLGYGFSSKSKFLVLTDCLNGMRVMQIENAMQSAAFSFSQKCVSLSDEIISHMPTNAYAWLVKAWASGELYEYDALNTSLQQSHVTAPNELWLAKFRLDLAERKRPLIDDDTKKAIDRDIAMMASSYQGSQELALRYMKDKAFRERVISVIETLPQEDQKRFISGVKNAKERG
jgi:hypothetical protein